MTLPLHPIFSRIGTTPTTLSPVGPLLMCNWSTPYTRASSPFGYRRSPLILNGFVADLKGPLRNLHAM
jgi:hypothetical protein